MPVSPYHSYGLWRNPFGELTRDERIELARVDVQPWLEFLQHDRSVLQVIGPCGFGKTTHLLALERALPETAYVYFPEEGTQPPLPSTRPLFIDEAQRMRFWRRLEVFSGVGPLVLATHVDLTQALLRHGFQVQTIDVGLPKSAQWVLEMLMARLDSSRLSPEALLPDSNGRSSPKVIFPVEITLAQVMAWQEKFGSNIRTLEHFLYEDLQRCVQSRRPWPTVT